MSRKRNDHYDAVLRELVPDKEEDISRDSQQEVMSGIMSNPINVQGESTTC